MSDKFFEQKNLHPKTHKRPDPQEQAENFYEMAVNNSDKFKETIDKALHDSSLLEKIANYLSTIIGFDDGTEKPVFLALAEDAPNEFKKLTDLAKQDNSILYSFIAAAEMKDPVIHKPAKEALSVLSKDAAMKEKIANYREPEIHIGFTM